MYGVAFSKTELVIQLNLVMRCYYFYMKKGFSRTVILCLATQGGINFGNW